MEAMLKNRLYIPWPSMDYDDMPFSSHLLSKEGYRWYHDHWIEGCFIRGLETLAEMFSINTLPGKICALGRLGKQYKYWSSALFDRPDYSEWQLAEKMKPPQIWNYDNIDQPNEAWFWAMKFPGYSTTYRT